MSCLFENVTMWTKSKISLFFLSFFRCFEIETKRIYPHRSETMSAAFFLSLLHEERQRKMEERSGFFFARKENEKKRKKCAFNSSVCLLKAARIENQRKDKKKIARKENEKTKKIPNIFFL